MDPRAFRIIGISISLCSLGLAAVCTAKFGLSNSPDRSVYLAPLFFLGLPLSFAGNIVSTIFIMSSKGPWYQALPIMISFLLQWQLVGWLLYRRGWTAD